MSSRFTIANPCSKKWADLRGEGRVRHCDACNTSVHAIEQYSREEWDQVWRESDGRLCALLQRESPEEPRSRRAVLAGALLTAISPLMAQTGRVRIRVTDVNGAVIANAEAALRGADDKPLRSAHADEVGEIVLQDLPMGDCRFVINAPGFDTRNLTVSIGSGNEVNVETRLVVGTIGQTVVIETNAEKLSSELPPELPPAAKRAKRRRWLIFW